jgi:hypothetical protein
MSELKVNKISPRSGTDVTLGDSGDTFTIPAGAILDTSGATLTLPTTIEVDVIEPQSGTTLTLGASGDTITIPSGATLDTSSADVVLPALDDQELNNPTVTNYVESVVAIGTVTTTHTIDLTNGTVQTATLTASTACTFTMPTATAGKSFILLLKQAAATGNGSATFTGVKFSALGAPTITATAGKMDILTFVADGTNWYGSYAQGYTP